jgi:hypothetical protein
MSNQNENNNQELEIENGISRNDIEKSDLNSLNQNQNQNQDQKQEEENIKTQNLQLQESNININSEIHSQIDEKNSQSLLTLTDEQLAKENGGRDDNDNNNIYDNSNLIPNEININQNINYEYFDEFNRPRYEDIVNFENNLREEMEKNSPLVSEKLTIDTLVAEYTDSIYQNSTLEFSKKIKHWRTVRRDGNCFYRSFLFRLFEEYILERNEKLHSKILKLIEESKRLCEDNGITWMVLEDFYNV